MATINIPLALPIVEAVIEAVPWDHSVVRIYIPPAACGSVVLPRYMFSDEINARIQLDGGHEEVTEIKQAPHAPGSLNATLKEWAGLGTTTISTEPPPDHPELTFDEPDDNPTPVTTKVAYVARAMHESIRGSLLFRIHTWDEYSEGDRAKFYKHARAAMEAMFVPTKEMVDRMSNIGPGRPYGVQETIDRWNAGVDAALGR